MPRDPAFPAHRRLQRALLTAALLALAGLSALVTATRAEFWPSGDWKGGKHNLSVSVDTTGCPPGMADSVKKAIGAWNSDSLTWKFKYEPDSSKADIKISCKNIVAGGTTWWDYDSPGNTRAGIDINPNDWGWCDDRYELVSTLVHELGHCARLKDTPKADQSKAMRGTQYKPGHGTGLSPADSAEAAESDTSRAVTVTSTPSSIQRQITFEVILGPSPGSPLFDLDRALDFELRAFAPSALHILGYHAIDPEHVMVQGIAAVPGATMEVYHLVIQYPEGVSVRQGILYVTDVPWQGWSPVAVAPPDTAVPDNLSPIRLYPTLSRHTGGQHMAYAWKIDGHLGAQGGENLMVTLPAGLHQVRLTAADEAGLESTDSMMVVVMHNVGVGEGGRSGLLQLTFPVPSRLARGMQIGYRLPAGAAVSMAVYDIQGRMVRTVLEAQVPEGRHTAAWDLRDGGGRRVSAGVYFCVLRAGGDSVVARMVLIH